MKFYAVAHVRRGWNPFEFMTYDFGEVDLDRLMIELAELVDGETLLVDIQLWNERKREKVASASST